MRSLYFLLAVAILASVLAFANMNIVVETYTFAPDVACDGLELRGIHYAFTVASTPSADCNAGTPVGPGETNNIQPPHIEGTAAGVLHLTFDVPTTRFGFGVAQGLRDSPQQVVIHLNRPGQGVLRQTVNLEITNDPAFVGGRYDYEGSAVKTATISFANPSGRFSVDNVTYFRPPGLP